MAEFRMPSLGADMDEGTVVEWRVRPGEEVHKGDIVAVVDTAKAAIEVEVFDDGVVEELVVPVGSRVPVGTVLATLGPLPASRPAARSKEAARAPGRGAVPVHSPLVRRLAAELGVDLATVPGTGPAGTVTRADVEAAAGTRPGPAPKSPALPRARRPAPVGGTTGPVRASPYARRLAAERGVDLGQVAGTGPGGAVTGTDVAAVSRPSRGAPEPARAAEAAPSAGSSTSERKQAMRDAIGGLMARSKREIPHYYLATTVDMAATVDWLREVNRDRPPAARLLPAAPLLKAAASAVRAVPEVNGLYRDGGFEPSPRVHLGVAISLRGGGLVAPAIHDADRMSVTDLMTALLDLVERARAGRLRGSEMADPTITVTNLGDLGVESVFGVIYPPQVALVGFGKLVERPWAVGGMLGVRPVLTASLSADHRVSDGHRGGLYLAEIDRLLQDPERL